MEPLRAFCSSGGEDSARRGAGGFGQSFREACKKFSKGKSPGEVINCMLELIRSEGQLEEVAEVIVEREEVAARMQRAVGIKSIDF